MRKLWYAGAGVVAGGFLLLAGASAQADVASPKTDAGVASYTDPVGDVLARTNGLRLSSPVGTDPLGRAPLLTLGQGDQQLFQVKPGQNTIGRAFPAYADERPESTGDTGQHRRLPAADVISGSFHDGNGSLRGVPFTDANSGAVRLPVVGGLPVIGGILPDGSHTLESASTGYPVVDELDGTFSVRGLPKRLSGPNRADLAGLPLGGSPVSAADLLPEASGPASPAPATSKYATVPARPGIASPSVAPSAIAPSSAAPASVAPSAAPSSVAPAEAPASEVPYSKADDPRLFEEPVDSMPTR